MDEIVYSSYDLEIVVTSTTVSVHLNDVDITFEYVLCGSTYTKKYSKLPTPPTDINEYDFLMGRMGKYLDQHGIVNNIDKVFIRMYNVYNYMLNYMDQIE